MALIKNFISWGKILLRYQESCVINGGTTTKYFSLAKDALQGDSSFLFIFALEILFLISLYKIET